MNLVSVLGKMRQTQNRLTYFCAASVSVPQVSAMSSTRIAVRSLTSPTRTMLATSFATFR